MFTIYPIIVNDRKNQFSTVAKKAKSKIVSAVIKVFYSLAYCII